jgi:hypothetical protein
VRDTSKLRVLQTDQTVPGRRLQGRCATTQRRRESGENGRRKVNLSAMSLGDNSSAELQISLMFLQVRNNSDDVFVISPNLTI